MTSATPANDENQRPFSAIGARDVAAARTILQMHSGRSTSIALRDVTNDELSDEEEKSDMECDLPKKSQPCPVRNSAPEDFDVSLPSEDELDYTSTHLNYSPKPILSTTISGDPFDLGPIRSLEMLKMGLAAKAELEKSNHFKGKLLTNRMKCPYYMTLDIGKEMKKIDVRELIDFFIFLIHYFMLLHFSAQNVFDQVNDRFYQKYLKM